MGEEEKRELARLKRLASEVAAKIHDVVEETLWSDYKLLDPLSRELIEACEKYYAYKREHSL